MKKDERKKRVAIVMGTMIIGGVEKALFELLNHFDYENYDVDLWLKENNLEITKQVNDHVKIRLWPSCSTKLLLKNNLKNFEFLYLLRGLIYRLIIRCTKTWEIESLYSVKLLPEIPSNYDCVIAYQYGIPELVATANRIIGKKHILWVHGNYRMSSTLVSLLAKEYATFDKIFCVSKATCQQFLEKWPFLSSRTQVIYNLLNSNAIIQSSIEILPNFRGKNILLSVGRLANEKGQQMIPRTTRLLLDAGYDIHWYLVGDGPLRETVEAEIAKYDVADRVILLGTQMNPYPYIKNCDIYVQPSFSEGYCTTTMEAKILRKPIVTTDAPGMREQFFSGENGLIVDAMTPEALFEGIRTLLDHPELREKFVENLSHEVCDNSGELQKLYDFIES